VIYLSYISEKEFNSRLKTIRVQNASKKRKEMLKAEKDKYKPKFKLPSTSKLVLLGVILLCIEIVIFCEYVMIVLGDTSAMYALIGIPATLVPIVWGYYSKSKAENTAGGIVYETAIQSKQDINEDLSGNNCDAQG
jgi:hypothetical protein